MLALRFFRANINTVKQQQGNSKMNAVTIVDGVYEGNTTSTFTLARGNERVSCTEVMYSAMQAFCLLALDLFLCYTAFILLFPCCCLTVFILAQKKRSASILFACTAPFFVL